MSSLTSTGAPDSAVTEAVVSTTFDNVSRYDTTITFVSRNYRRLDSIFITSDVAAGLLSSSENLPVR